MYTLFLLKMFKSNTPRHVSTWHGLVNNAPKRTLSDDTGVLAFLILTSPHKYLMELRSGFCGEKTVTVRSPWFSLDFMHFVQSLEAGVSH